MMKLLITGYKEQFFIMNIFLQVNFCPMSKSV